jgi:hypothetical protein
LGKEVCNETILSCRATVSSKGRNIRAGTIVHSG